MDRYSFAPSQELLQQLEAIAEAEGTPVSALIAKFLNQSANEWQPPENQPYNTQVQPNEDNSKQSRELSKGLSNPTQEELNSTFGPASGGPTKHKPKPKPDVPVRKLDPERYVHYGRGPHS